MARRARFLILGDTRLTGADWLRPCGLEGVCVRAESWDAALNQLPCQSFDALVSNPTDPAVPCGLRELMQARQVGLRFMLFKPFRVDQFRDARMSSEPQPAECG